MMSFPLRRRSPISRCSRKGRRTRVFLLQRGSVGKGGIISFAEKTKNLAGFVGSMDNFYLGIIINKKTGITSLEQIKRRSSL